MGGTEKHWAIVEAVCVERCMDSNEAARVAVFESGFHQSKSVSPCRDQGFEKLISSEIDAVGPYFVESDKFVSAQQEERTPEAEEQVSLSPEVTAGLDVPEGLSRLQK